MKPTTMTLAAGLLLALPALAADHHYDGFLCCNMRTTGSWISDINYEENGKHMIPAGTPLTVLGQGRNRIKVKIEGKEQGIGNDYSRDLSLDNFEKRYVVAEDPNTKINAYPPNVANAIRQARVMIGMNRDQVLMALGYPVSSETPDLNAKMWKFWLFSFTEFHVLFDDAGRVSGVDADGGTRAKVLAE